MTKNPNRRLLIVSNRLPFQAKVKNRKIEVKESDGGLVSALKSYFDSTGNKYSFDSTCWIGSADFQGKHWQKIKQKHLSGLSYEVEPIFLEKKTYNKYYNGFCNATLWPLFHYFPSFVDFDVETFNEYEEVNRIFAEKIITMIEPNDTIWVHDYQLMLVPGMIRAQRPDATIGFFMHIPFPSFEVFRLLHRPWKDKIINGLLGADLIGFHTHEYVQHFLKSVQMTSGYDHQFRSILLPTRSVKTEMFPLGIDYQKFNQSIQSPQVVERKEAIRNNFPEKKIIFSVDRLDYTKGITHRLLGFERFLELHPEWKEKVVFVQVVVPSRQIITKYTERKKLIEEEVGRINGRYSNLHWQPIIYRYNHLSFEELSSMYNAADIGLITPLRDGMNLVAKEFVASKSETGVLILSELAGAANEMGEAIQVNPMDKNEVSAAIFTALTMEPEVQKFKLETLQQRLKEYTIVDWMNDFLSQLSETKHFQKKQETKHFSGPVFNKFKNDFGNSRKRALLLDYDGTLVPYSKHPSLAIPDDNLLNLLKKLSDDDRNDITIVSGRDSASLQKWFAALPINLVSEHGAAMRLKNSEWQYFLDTEHSWKKIIQPTLTLFSQRSPGSFIEEKNHTLVWHYRNVESDLGFIRSRELLDNLHHLVRNSNLNIIDGNKVIEVRNAGVDKGTITRKLLDANQYDFVMAVGDDKTDEDMFRALDHNAYTIKIGQGHTVANYFLTDQKEVTKLLNNLAQIQQPETVYESQL